jgi:hypothetical protein
LLDGRKASRLSGFPQLSISREQCERRKSTTLVCGGRLNVVYDQNLYGRLRRNQLEAELLLNRGE